MKAYKLNPGDPVRFCNQDVGIVEEAKEDGIVFVWFLEWLNRDPPVLVRWRCSLYALEHVSLKEYMSEVRPATCQRSWRDRVARAVNALRGR